MKALLWAISATPARWSLATIPGLCGSQGNNSAGAAGAVCRSQTPEGRVSSPSPASPSPFVGKPVYASDDVYLRPHRHQQQLCRSRRSRFISSGVCVVDFCRQGRLGSSTAAHRQLRRLAAKHHRGHWRLSNQSEVHNAVASLAAKINAIQKMLA